MTTPERDVAGVIAPPPVIFLATLIAGSALDWWWPVRLAGADAHAIRWVGMALVVVSLVLAALATREFRRARTSVRPDRPTSAIIRRGPFRLSRNPLYALAFVVLVGVALWRNSAAMLLMISPAFLIITKGVVEREERYLTRKFGDDYVAYTREVRRWL